MRKGSAVIVVIIVVALVAIGGLAYYALRPKNNSTSVESGNLANNVINTPIPKDDRALIEDLAKADCQANVNSKGEPYKFKITTTGQADEKIRIYDKTFAGLAVACAPDDNSFVQDKGGMGWVLTLKKVNGIWVIIDRGTQAMTREQEIQFGISASTWDK